MIRLFGKSHAASRIRQETDDREKMERLEEAERTLADLQARKEKAVTFLTERHERNHWREAIERMIQGAH